LKKIRNEVILPSKENYNLYTRKRLLKEKWNVYKYSICCDKQAVAAVEGGSGARILGWIDGFQRYSLPTDESENKLRNIWKYRWSPVEVWLKDEIDNYEEIAEGNTYEVVAEEGPFAVVKIPQAEGVTLEAWNLNELNNSPNPNFFTSYLGPGYNSAQLRGDINNEDPRIATYHYIPIGGSLVTVLDTLDTLSSNLSQFVTCQINVRGHLVELFELPTSLSIWVQKQEGEGVTLSDAIYVFNEQNVVDGSCTPCLLGDIEENDL
jgi:hypothetical protein